VITTVKYIQIWGGLNFTLFAHVCGFADNLKPAHLYTIFVFFTLLGIGFGRAFQIKKKLWERDQFWKLLTKIFKENV